MEDKSFKTIVHHSEGLYKEKGSKFLAFAFPVENLEDVKASLDQLRKEYHDARHHCYAYIIEDGNNQLVRANDDGEPNHSAGDPILGQIKSFELTNTLIVVIRYFGGTKLGVGGLIHAYKVSSEEALSKNKIITVELKAHLIISYGYEKTSSLMRILKEFNADIKSQEYNERCLIRFEIKPSTEASLRKKVVLLDDIQLL